MKTKLLGNLETQVMDIVWQAPDSVSVRDVISILKKKRKIAYTTIMTIMTRLVKKDILVRKRYGLSYRYEPRISQERFIEKSVHLIFTATVSSLGNEAVAHFVKEIKKLSTQKRRELLKILGEN